MSFYICYCGNTSENHNFRHKYEDISQVTIDIDDDGLEFFRLDATNFPIKTKVKCDKDNCNADIGIHNTDLIPHEFVPVEIKYKEINLTLPLDVQCRYDNCVQLKDHGKVNTHHFTTKVFIENKAEQDVVNISHPEDEDIKINWK